MAIPKKLTRITPLDESGLQVRSCGGEDDEKKSRTVEGHPIVFGVRSQNLIGWSSQREMYEVMEPESITDELIRNSDIILNAFHNNEIIFGRSCKGKGTLRMCKDERGISISCDMPETHAADDMLELIKLGDITGMSFAFRADEEDSENGVSYEKLSERSPDNKEVWIRHVKKVTRLYDVSIVGTPAYTQTDIKANREWEENIDAKLRDMDNPSDDEEKPKSITREQTRMKLQIRQHQRELDLMDM